VTKASETWGDIAKELQELAQNTEDTVGAGLKTGAARARRPPASSWPSW